LALTKTYVKRERRMTILVMVIFFCTFPFLYLIESIPRVYLIVIQALPAVLAGVVEFLTLWLIEPPDNLDSKISLLLLVLIILVQPFFPGTGLIFALADNSIFLTPIFWVAQGGFFVSWFAGKMIARESFFIVKRNQILD